MFNLRLKNLFDMSTLDLAGDYTFSQIIINVIAALFCGLLIYAVYRKTYTGVLFSRNFGVTTVIVTMITSLIVMAIHGNLTLSLGMIGALSIVRFRAPIKDPKDLAFLFWAITTGIICGISAYKLALVSVVMVSVVLFILSKRIGLSTPYLLVLEMGRHIDKKKVDETLQAGCSRFKERSITVTADKTEIVYEILLRKVTSADLIDHIKVIPGISQAVMVSYDGELNEGR